MRRIFFACAALVSTGCAGLLGLDDFTEGEAGAGGGSTTSTGGDPSSTGDTGSTTGSTAPGSGGSGGSGGGEGGMAPLEVTPGETVKVGVLRSLQFTANVPATWSVDEPDGGTIDEDGFYISPDDPGTFHVTATSVGNPDDSVTVTVTAAPLGVRVLSGQPGGPGTLDGAPSRSRVSRVEGMVALDNGQKILFTDADTHTVRVMDDNQTVTTVAGTPYQSGAVDAAGPDARFNRPTGVAADRDGNVAFLIDQDNYCIRRINLANGAVTTLAGACGERGHVDGANGAASRFDDLESIVMGPSGNRLYVCEAGGDASVRAINVNTGATTTLTNPDLDVSYGCLLSSRYYDDVFVHPGNVNTPVLRSFRDVLPLDAITTVVVAPIPATLNNIQAMAADTGWGSNDILVGQNRTVHRLDLSNPGDGFLPYFGSDAVEEYVDGTLDDVRLSGARAMAANGGYGEFYFSDSVSTLRLIDRDDDTVRTVAGKPANIVAIDGEKDVGRLVSPFALELDAEGNVYTASLGESEDNTIRRTDAATGEITTFSGVRGFTKEIVDGDFDEATFGFVVDLVRVGDDLYAMDLFAQTIRRVSLADGSVVTIAGQTGVAGFQDGIGEGALFDFEEGGGLATDGTDLYVADAQNFAIRKIALATNEVTTIAGGTDGTANGTGTDAEFRSPAGVAYDGGYLYIADYVDHVIRRMDLASGEVTTLMGLSGIEGTTDGGTAEATFRAPFRLIGDGIGNLYVTGLGFDSEGETTAIRRIDLADLEASSFAGVPTQRGFLVGPLPASVSCPTGLRVDALGDLVFADFCDGAVGVVRTL